MEVLYISYDGILEALGQSQVVSYLRGLANTHTITLLSYEKPRDLKDLVTFRQTAQDLRAHGIRWVRLRYHKWPSLLMTGWDVAGGLLVGIVVCWKRRVRLVHARGYVPSVIALCLKRLCGAKFLFDMRGFWADEKVDAGHWSRESWVYRLAKWWEQRFFEQADAIVSLTSAGVSMFPQLGYAIPSTTSIAVIPTCADLTKFSPGPKDPELVRQFQLGGATVVGCVGTLSNWYLRTPTLQYLALLAARLERAKIFFVTQEDHTLLRRDALAVGISSTQLVLTQANFSSMGAYLRLMDLGVFFIQPTFSKQASSATKLGEFLATGVPVVINEGVGDSNPIVREYRAGVIVSDMAPADFEASLPAVQRLLSDAQRSERCRAAAVQYFDLREGVKRYAHMYGMLNGSVQPGQPVELVAMKSLAAS